MNHKQGDGATSNNLNLSLIMAQRPNVNVDPAMMVQISLYSRNRKVNVLQNILENVILAEIGRQCYRRCDGAKNKST